MAKTYTYKIVDVADDERKSRVKITVDFYEEYTDNSGKPSKEKVEQKTLAFSTELTDEQINDEIKKVGAVYFEDVARTEMLKEQEKKRDERREKLDKLLNQDEQTIWTDKKDK